LAASAGDRGGVGGRAGVDDRAARLRGPTLARSRRSLRLAGRAGVCTHQADLCGCRGRSRTDWWGRARRRACRPQRPWFGWRWWAIRSWPTHTRTDTRVCAWLPKYTMATATCAAPFAPCAALARTLLPFSATSLTAAASFRLTGPSPPTPTHARTHTQTNTHIHHTRRACAFPCVRLYVRMCVSFSG
jgi:hypothetical protein